MTGGRDYIMKTRHPFSVLSGVLLVTAAGLAQSVVPPVTETAPAQPAANTPTSPAENQTQPALSGAQVDDLTGPIALYPDPLIAQILPAATFPTDIVLAARMINRGATQQELDAQDWDASVKALAHYPSIVKMMSERLEWTAQLGAAFVREPDEVMDSIQRLRVKARALGQLRDTPQQQVIVEEPEAQTTVVRIVPASSEVVYVPTYQPEVVYVQPYTSAYIASPYIWFGTGFAIGAWLNLDCDWYGRRCYYPYGWSWSSYPSWGWGFSWGYNSCYSGWGWNTWCGTGHGWHDSWHHDGHGGWDGHGHGHGGWDDGHGRTNDANVHAWSRSGSRPVAPLRTNQAVADWTRHTGVPGYRRAPASASGSAVSAGNANSFKLPPTSQAGMGDTSRRFSSERAFGRTMSPSQIQERLGTAGSSRSSVSRPGMARGDTSPRASDRTVPNLGSKYSSPGRTTTNSDMLRRTRELPAVKNGRTVPYRGSTSSSAGKPMVVPGSNDVRSSGSSNRVRVYTPSRSSSPAARSAPSRTSAPSASSGRQGLSRSPARSAPRASSPARSAAPRSAPSRGSAPGNRRSK